MHKRIQLLATTRSAHYVESRPHLETYASPGHVYQSCCVFILQAMHGQIQLLTIRGQWTSGGHMPLSQMTSEMACCMTATSAALAHWHLLSTAVLMTWTKAKLR